MKKALALTAVIAFAMMLGFGLQSASADGVLFPYFTSGGGDLTFVQIINTNAATSDESETLHYTYVYNSGEEICEHFDDNGDTSENDILLYEVTDALAPANSGQLLPGDTTSTSPALTVSPAWGYLVVDNDNFGDRSEGTIQGQEIVVNTNDLYAFILNGINDPGEYDDENQWDDNTSDHHTMSFMPMDYADTVWYAFPIDGDDLTDPDPNTYGIDDCTALDDCELEIGESHTSDPDGIYNHNESLKSGAPVVHPGCIYEDDPSDAITGLPGWQSNDFFFALDEVLTGAQYNAVKNTGGWMRSDFDSPDYGFIYKIVSSNIFGTLLTGMVYEPDNTNDFYGPYYSYTK